MMGTLGIFGGVMLVEGIGIFAVMKFFGAEPDPTQGMTQQLVTTRPFSDSKEIEVAQVRVQNTQGDRTILYSVTVNIRINSDPNTVRLVEEDFLKNRRATITDAISRILRSADHKDMTQPGLETLKRQIRFELSSMLGDDTIIQQVLIPEFTPLPTGF